MRQANSQNKIDAPESKIQKPGIEYIYPVLEQKQKYIKI